MKRFFFTVLCVFACACACAQNYNVAMPGQRKVVKADSTGVTTTQYVTDTESDKIYFKGSSYMYKGKELSEDEFVAKMQAECPPAYEQYQKSVRLKHSGIVMLSTGGAALAVGAGLFIWGGVTAEYVTVGNYGYYKTQQLVWNWQMISGMALMVGGGGVLIGGAAVLLAVAPNAKHKAHQVYNTQCASKDAPLTLNYGLTGSGLSLALNF